MKAQIKVDKLSRKIMLLGFVLKNNKKSIDRGGKVRTTHIRTLGRAFLLLFSIFIKLNAFRPAPVLSHLLLTKI